MNEAQALAFERRWGAPGPPPNPAWRCCYRCGEWLPCEARLWCMPHRLCHACKNDEKRGIWPYTAQWHRKNRWDATGHLVRRCCTCRMWKPLVEFYRISKRDKNTRRVWDYPSPECMQCTQARVKSGLTLPQYRRSIAA